MNYFKKQDQIYLSLNGADISLSPDAFHEKISSVIPLDGVRSIHLAVHDLADLNLISFSVIRNLAHFMRNREIAVHFKAPPKLHRLLKKLNLNSAFASFMWVD